jgi:hypothetical protein
MPACRRNPCLGLSLGLSVVSFVWLGAFGSSVAGQSPLRWNVVEQGAKGDAAADNTAVFQATLDAAAKAGGGIVEVPAGRYRIKGTLSIPAGVTLQGTYRVPPTVVRSNDPKPDGSVLLAYAGRGEPEAAPFIRLAGKNAAIAGLVVDYPEWKQSDVPPVPYPPCVYSSDTDNVGVSECCFLNAYEGIKFVRAARHLVRNVTGYPSKRGLFVDECYDIGHIENVHFWPFGVAYQPNDPYCKWVNTQGVAFELARTDWHYVHNTFCFGYGVGYKFSASKNGSTNGNFLGLGADSCRRAVVVEQAQSAGLLITNGEFVGRWESADSVGLEIDPKAEGKVSLVNCSFWGPLDQCVWMRSPVGQFTASACHFVNWDNRRRGSPAIRLDAGKAIVQGCTFAEDGLHVVVAEKVRSALLTSNQAEAGFHVENHAGKRTQCLANEEDPIDMNGPARTSYRVEVGSPGDDRYLRGFHGREKVDLKPQGHSTMRWSLPRSQLILPVVPGKPYTMTLAISAPGGAMEPSAGLYLDGKQIASLPKDGRSMVVSLPPSAADKVVVELRCRGWTPKTQTPGSQDDRTLGLSVYSVTMRTQDAGETLFDANVGEWIKPQPGKAKPQ